MSKKKPQVQVAEPRAYPKGDEIAGHKIKLLVEVDDQWYDVPNGTWFSSGTYMYAINEGMVTQVVRDVGPIPAPTRWRPDA